MNNIKLIDILYNIKDRETDFCIFKAVIPYLKHKSSFYNLSQKEEKVNSFIEYDNLPDNIQDIVRDLVYEKHKSSDYKLTCTKEDFLKLYNFLDLMLFNMKDFRCLFRKFIYSHRDDKDFLFKTIDIHRSYRMLKITKMELWLKLLHIPENIQSVELLKCYIKDMTDKGNPDFIWFYAVYFLRNYESEKAENVLLENWQQNKHAESLFEYANILKFYPRNREKVMGLFLDDWKQNKNCESLHEYARQLVMGNAVEKKEARDIFLQNWLENNEPRSLDEYAFCLSRGIGGNIDINKAREMYKINYEKNKHPQSMHEYALFLETGRGGDKDIEKARQIYFENWNENKFGASLEKYIYFLKEGIGGDKDLQTALKLSSEKLCLLDHYYNKLMK